MDQQKSDLRLIEELHRIDEQASKMQDYKVLRSIMSDEAVVMPPGAGFLMGRERLDAAFAKMESAHKTEEILEYAFDFKEVLIVEGYAIEFGTIKGRSRPLNADTYTETVYKVMRILRKEESGWKVFRTIWNELKAP